MQEDKLLKKLIHKWIKKNKVTDVILFGSYSRGGYYPQDVDICIIIPTSREKEAIDILASFKKQVNNPRLHVSIITERDFIKGDSTLVKTLLSEGVSISKNEPLSNIYGFENKTIFTYSLKGFKPSERVRFHYALNGRRGSMGVLKESDARIMGNGVIIAPTSKEEMIKNTLDMWNIAYESRKILFG